MNETPIKIFSGRANRPLAERISAHIGIPLGECQIDNFSDGEVWVKYGENIRGCDVFIIQSTQQPAQNLLELLIMIDAARRASAKRVTAVIPYFGYARQDRKDQPRVSITAKLIANIITSSGADRVISMDLHAPQIQGFFDIPFDHLYSSVVFINMFPPEQFPNLVVVSPDVGGIKMARAFAKRLGADLVVLDKRRNRANESEIMNVIGNVEGKKVLLVDDIIDTGGTFCNASLAVLEKGATAVYGACTHPVFSGKAADRIVQSRISKMIVTDSIPLHDHIAATGVVEVRSVAELFGEAIVRTHNHESITSLFDIDKS